LDEWRTVVAELDDGAEVGGGVGNSPAGRRHTKPSSLTYLLEHSSWRLAGSVEWPWRAGSTVEVK
jgi:hypothetical protein